MITSGVDYTGALFSVNATYLILNTISHDIYRHKETESDLPHILKIKYSLGPQTRPPLTLGCV